MGKREGDCLIEHLNRLNIKETRRSIYFLCLFLMIGILVGCEKEKITHPHVESSHLPFSKVNPGPAFLGKEVIPIQTLEGTFSEIVGWLSNQSILYITNLGQESYLYAYDLSTGKSSLVYQTEFPIVTADISPQRKKILIHTAPSSYTGKLTVIETDGKLLYETDIESIELSFSWNGESEQKLLVTAFYEDWSYRTFILDTEIKEISEIDLPQPFLEWPKDNEILYLDWEEENISLTAPLVKKNIITGKEEVVLAAGHYLDFIDQSVLVVSADQDNDKQANYVVMDQNYNEISSFHAPQLSVFSGWLVPYYDVLESLSSLLYLRPYKSGEADVYNEGFTLTERSFEDGNETILMEQVENEPLECSPNGAMCLYGYQLEKIIDLKEREIINLLDY